MAKELAKKLINAGVHFGHGVSRWNPKMDAFIFAKRGNIHIIDVKKTLKGLLISKKLLVEVVSSGKDVVFVGTKHRPKRPLRPSQRSAGCTMSPSDGSEECLPISGRYALDCRDWSNSKPWRRMERLTVKARSKPQGSNVRCERSEPISRAFGICLVCPVLW